jgi:hypothetical protein
MSTHKIFEDRKTYPLQIGLGKTGTFAQLSEELSYQGFEYQYNREEPYSQFGKAEYLNPTTGEKATLTRVKNGEPAHWLPRPPGATSWLAKTAQQPDTWQAIKETDKPQ